MGLRDAFVVEILCVYHVVFDVVWVMRAVVNYEQYLSVGFLYIFA